MFLVTNDFFISEFYDHLKLQTVNENCKQVEESLALLKVIIVNKFKEIQKNLNFNK